MKSFNQFLGERSEDLTPERQRLNLGVSPGQQSLPGMGKRSGQEKPAKKPQYNPKYYNADGTLKPNAVQTYIQGRAGKEYNRPGVKLTPETKARIDAANATFASAAKGDPKATQQVSQWTKEFKAKHGLNPAEIVSVPVKPRKAADDAFAKKLGLDTPEGAAAAQDAARDMTADAKKGQTNLKGGPTPQIKPTKPVKLAPAPAPTSAKVQPRTSTTSSQGTTVSPVPVKQPEKLPVKSTPTSAKSLVRGGVSRPVTTITTPSPISVTSGSSSSTSLTKQIGKELRKTMSAERTARTAANNRAWARSIKGLGAISAGLEGKYAYDMAKAEGASNKRATGAGIARALGGLTGAGLGAVGGGILGPIGSIAGGSLGYTQGAEAGTKLFNRIVKPGEKVTTQSVVRNVTDLYRDKVPTSIRSRVPEGLKRTFKDFMLRSGRKYGEWTRSQNRNEEYQLNELDIKSTISKAQSAISRSPVGRTVSAVTNNPIVRTTGRVLGGGLNIGFNRALGLEKLTTDDPNVGPVERGLGAVSLVSPPGMSQVTGLAHNIIGGSNTLKRADRALARSHERALKSNTQGYLQNLGMSF